MWKQKKNCVYIKKEKSKRISALLTTTMVVQRDVIEALEDAGMRDKVKVMVGGAPVNREWAEEIGADGYAEDAMRAVEIARELMEQ